MIIDRILERQKIGEKNPYSNKDYEKYLEWVINLMQMFISLEHGN